MEKTQSDQEIFNALLTKLLRRNASNQIFIRTFRKQLNRRYKAQKIDHSICRSISKQTENYPQCKMKSIPKAEFGKQKTKLLQTNNTIEVIDQLSKMASLPSIKPIQIYDLQSSKEEIPKQSLLCNKQVHSFFKRTHKVKQNVSLRTYEKPIRCSYQGPQNTKKYQLNINSLVFNSKAKSKATCKADFSAVMKERTENYQKSESKAIKNTKEFDEIQSKIILPMISSIHLSNQFQHSIQNSIEIQQKKQQSNYQNKQKFGLTYRIKAFKLKKYA